MTARGTRYYEIFMIAFLFQGQQVRMERIRDELGARRVFHVAHDHANTRRSVGATVRHEKGVRPEQRRGGDAVVRHTRGGQNQLQNAPRRQTRPGIHSRIIYAFYRIPV